MTPLTTEQDHEKLNALLDANQAAWRSIGTQFEREQPLPKDYVTAILGAVVQSLEVGLYLIKQPRNSAGCPILGNEHLAMLEQATAWVKDVEKQVCARFGRPQSKKDGHT